MHVFLVFNYNKTHEMSNICVLYLIEQKKILGVTMFLQVCVNHCLPKYD